jgi:hypothetical protein
MNLGEIFRSISNFLSVESLERFFNFVLPSLLLILTAYITFKLNDNANKRELVFQEKKEAYIGILEAYKEVARISKTRDHYDLWSVDEGSNGYSIQDQIKAQEDFDYWAIRCKLVGSQEVNEHIELLTDTESNSDERAALNNLHNAIRKDLQVD